MELNLQSPKEILKCQHFLMCQLLLLSFRTQLILQLQQGIYHGQFLNLQPSITTFATLWLSLARIHCVSY